MSEAVKTVNYCTHAIEDIRATAGVAAEKGMRITAKRLQVVIEMMTHAQKFLLPNCAELVDSASLKETHLDLLQLPFPITAFEASWQKEESDTVVLNGVAESLSTRRIALCWEMSNEFDPFPGLPETEMFKRQYPAGGVFIYPISYSDELRTWNAGTGGRFVPRDYTPPKDAMTLPASALVEQAKRAAGHIAANAFKHLAEPFVLLPEVFDFIIQNKGGDVDAALSHVMYDSNDEVTMTVQACAVLNCANIATIDVAPSRASNAKRAATRKSPFFSYKVLQLDFDKRAKKSTGKGAHAGPRTHLRRGHIRRLENRITWVRAALINANGEQGAIVKDYDMTQPPKR